MILIKPVRIHHSKFSITSGLTDIQNSPRPNNNQSQFHLALQFNFITMKYMSVVGDECGFSSVLRYIMEMQVFFKNKYVRNTALKLGKN